MPESIGVSAEGATRHRSQSASVEDVHAAIERLSPSEQRFLLLVVDGVADYAAMTSTPDDEVRTALFFLLDAGIAMRRRAPGIRRALTRTLAPALNDIDPIPQATVEQARKLSALKTSLLRQGAVSAIVIADARETTANNARQWISRHRKANRLFTVSHGGETLVPAFLLDETLEPRGAARPAIRALRSAGEDGWALWTWFATPSAWLDGQIPAHVLRTNPRLVSLAAHQRAAAVD